MGGTRLDAKCMDACELLLNRNKIDPFLKRMVTGDEKSVTYDNVKRKRSWSKSDEAAQTVAKPGLTARKVLLYVYLAFCISRAIRLIF